MFQTCSCNKDELQSHSIHWMQMFPQKCSSLKIHTAQIGIYLVCTSGWAECTAKNLTMQVTGWMESGVATSFPTQLLRNSVLKYPPAKVEFVLWLSWAQLQYGHKAPRTIIAFQAAIKALCHSCSLHSSSRKMPILKLSSH